jgi:hypothetical protein
MGAMAGAAGDRPIFKTDGFFPPSLSLSLSHVLLSL